MSESLSKPWILGLTGGIGSGKTTVSGFFAQLGIHIVDADEWSRQALAPGSPLVKQVLERFGSACLMPDQTQVLNRAWLRDQVFRSEQDKQWLESLVHPWVNQAIDKDLNQAQGPYVILSSPLLFETGQNKRCQRVLVMDLPEKLQIERSCLRDGVSQESIQQVMRHQWTRAQRLSLADDILDTSQDLIRVEKAVKQLHQAYIDQHSLT